MDLQRTPHKLQLLSLRIIIKRELIYIFSFLLLLLTLSIIFLHYFQGPRFSRSLLSNSFLSQILPHDHLKEKLASHHEACDYSNGQWVRDNGYRLQSYTENCPFLDLGFQCRRNGRKDEDYLKWRWQPYGCDLPRFNGSDLLERSRNGRIVFAGDSIGRNQWESLICMLAQTIPNQSSIYEENANPITKHKGFLSIKFLQHNLTVQYYRTPFLVSVGRLPPNSTDNRILRTIRIDELHWYSQHWVGADVLIFNDGHWWNKDKTINSGSYFQERGIVNKTMDVVEAYKRSLQTWKLWATQKLDHGKSHIFFRSYSPVHYRGGTWKEGGRCDTDTTPQTNHTLLEGENLNNQYMADVIKQMEMEDVKRKVQFLNITYLSEFRNDGHPSTHREPGTPLPIVQDCSHWCLPGVPDTWNEILYAQLLLKEFKTK